VSTPGPVVIVEGVYKKYCSSLRHGMVYGIIDIGKLVFGGKPVSASLRKQEFWALHQVSFRLDKGEALGIIGLNGAGKSTLLKLLNGIILPDRGEIRMKGRVGALIEVGAGFHPNLTGRENVYVNGAILGMSKRDIDCKLDDIVAFSGIGSFLDTPVKFYSSGMIVRLGFSVVAHLNCDILLVDEVLSVGDIQFRAKCYNKMRELMKKGVTCIIVSHNMYDIRKFCNVVLNLERGRVIGFGDRDEVVDAYLYRTNELGAIRHYSAPILIPHMRKAAPVVLEEISVLGSSGQRTKEFNPRDPLVVRLDFEVHEPRNYVLWLEVIGQDGGRVFTLNSPVGDHALYFPRGRHTIWATSVTPSLVPGLYGVNAYVWDKRVHMYVDYLDGPSIQVRRTESMDDRWGAIRVTSQWTSKPLAPAGHS